MMSKVLFTILCVVIGFFVIQTARLLYAAIDRDMVPRGDVVVLVFLALLGGLVWGVYIGQKKSN